MKIHSTHFLAFVFVADKHCNFLKKARLVHNTRVRSTTSGFGLDNEKSKHESGQFKYLYIYHLTTTLRINHQNLVC